MQRGETYQPSPEDENRIDLTSRVGPLLGASALAQCPACGHELDLPPPPKSVSWGERYSMRRLLKRRSDQRIVRALRTSAESRNRRWNVTREEIIDNARKQEEDRKRRLIARDSASASRHLLIRSSRGD
jgi:rRNA maturation protein Nop10